jgi:phosphoglycerol transferase MdoB-like AlkP superfamily enzyme
VSIAAASPRALVSGDETTVAVTITNTGSRAWDATSFHVSYHWLWTVPRELASRSRGNVPYHDGIRTDLTTAVAPGASARLEARLLAPSLPGVYWLQWDMVEEGRAWFAQVAPRQPRTLVVVVPPLVWALAPLPLLVAAIGGWRLAAGRRTASLPTASPPYDALWCAAVLAIKPLMVVREALLEPTAVAYWLTIAVALVVPALVAAALPRRARVWTLLAIGMFASLVVLADVVYYRFFGDIVSGPALLGAHQTGRVWGSIRSLFTPGLVWIVADWPFAVWMAMRLTRSRHRDAPVARRVLATAAVLLIVAAVGLLLSAPHVLAATPLDQMFRNRAVAEQLGPFGYHAYDAWTYARARWFKAHASPQEIDDAVAWFASRAPLRSGKYPPFNAAPGANLIVVQVESLQDFVVDLTVDGQEIMPHLRRWTDDSLRFTNVTDQTNEGRTSDAEFTTMTSLLPLDHGAVAFRYPANHYIALPRVLREHGYATLSAVAFEPGFWNREVTHPQYGFERTLFEPDFTMTEQIGWGLNDRDFLQQMVPHLEQLKPPFLAWMITLSLHHPFEDFPAAHKTLKLGRLEGTSFGNYLHTMHFFDEALEAFKASLRRDGLLDRSALVVFGDHDAGFTRTPELAAAMRVGSTDAAWMLNDRIPWFVRLPPSTLACDVCWPRGLRISSPAGQTDFAPTLLGLLGIDASPLPYAGRNLLGAPDDPPIVRPYGDWLDSHHLFFNRGSERVCYDLERRSEVDALACASSGQDAEARRAHDTSRLVVSEDLQTTIAERLKNAQLSTLNSQR